MASSGYLELIIGPMFSGKTSKLMQIYNELKAYCEHVEPNLKPFAIKI
jgi:thymidine kinase